jgi:hypothetical protein
MCYGIVCYWLLSIYLEEYSDDGIAIFDQFDTGSECQNHVNGSEMKQTRFVVILSLRSEILTCKTLCIIQHKRAK